jgi:predicted O-linked N-acetylglucosamine transferase (SPINDLY family)
MNSLQEIYARAVGDHREGRLREAAAGYSAVVNAEPGAWEAVMMLGLVTFQFGESGKAVDLLRRAAELAPQNDSCHANLGMALGAAGRFVEAEAALRTALQLDGRRGDSWNYLGDALLHTGRLEEAIACFRRSLEVQPDAAVGSKLLIVLHCHPASTPAALLEEHVRWDEKYARPVARSAANFQLSRPRGGPLKVGYVSPVLSQNPVGRFLLPLLMNHDRARFSAYCYTDTPATDSLAGPLREAAYAWRCTAGIDNATVAEMIRADGIDVLVDLAAHIEGNRLLAFARRAAPVQVTWLSYCSTTGLKEMDYRLTDPFLDPPGVDVGNYTEKTVWLPRTYWCYPAHANVPEVGALPAQRAGRMTFGCLCNFVKITLPTLGMWSQVLRAVPGGHLILSVQHEDQRKVIRCALAGEGIDLGRVEFLPAMPLGEYFKVYGQIDVALDPHPYPGGTTTCDALYMGVPVVTLPGKTAVSRAGVSLLNNVGLRELVARSPEDYVQIAAGLAGDVGRLTSIRAALRWRMLKSPVMDGVAFARGVEEAFIRMWRERRRVTVL